MKAAFEGDDFVRTVFVPRAVFARELDRAFIRFRARIGKEPRSKQPVRPAPVPA